MFNSSFTVRFRKMEAKHSTVVLGVTAVVPNLNGLLLFTEDGKGYQIESHEMLSYDEGDSLHIRMKIEYSDEDDFDLYLEGTYDLHDHRKK